MTTGHGVLRGRARLLAWMSARLARSAPEFEAGAVQKGTGPLGGPAIVDLVDRSQASVCGAVRSVNPRPRANVSALVVEIFDGSKTVNLIWLGRRRIGGVVPGTYLNAHGRVTYRHGIPTILNPAYEIRPDRGRQ
jgi:hypothetical protein